MGLPAVDQAGVASAAGNPLPRTFRGFDLDLQSDRLYDLDSDIPDVIGLRAIQPDVAVIKVMSIPDNCCIRVVIPDDHLGTDGFDEILLHDMEEEDPPFVALSDLSGCLHLDWPRAIFSFMGRSGGSRTFAPRVPGAFRIYPIWTVYILWQVHSAKTGRHVACYHLDLAQLWWCPVTWCTVWRGTPQDCIDHMRKAHNVPATVKAANLARWFPPWTVSREQWTMILRFHRYRVISRAGTHVASRGTYMAWVRAIASQMSQTTP